MLNLNRAILSAKPLNQLVNELIETAEPQSPNYRQYLGASSIGAECLRRIQYDWMCDPQFPASTRDIFASAASNFCPPLIVAILTAFLGGAFSFFSILSPSCYAPGYNFWWPVSPAK